MPTLADLRTFARYHLVRRPADHPARETELGVSPLGYEPRAYVARLRAYGARGFRVRTLAELEHRGRRFPMLELDWVPPGAQRRLLVLAGVHGNEQAGLLAVPPILDAVSGASLPLEVRVLAPVNPVGAAHLSRYNAAGFDINRDFLRFETPEARAVRRAFDARRPDFVVSLHEGPQEATFMFTNRRVPAPLARRLLRAMSDAGTPLATRDYFGRPLEPPGLAPLSPAMALLHALWGVSLGMMTSGTWAERQGVPEITLESSWTSPRREARLRGHVALVTALARELAAPP